MLNHKDIDLLEAYTYGEISPVAEADLRERLKQDADFAAAVRRWELLEREGFVTAPSKNTRAAVEEALEKQPDQKMEPPVKKPWWWYLLGLLLVVGLVVAVWSLFVKPSSAPAAAPPSEVPAESLESAQDQVYADLVDEYFRHLPSENFHLGSAETLEERALAAYEARDYETALPLLLETVEMGGDSLNLLYAGVAALGSGDGKNPLKEIVVNTNSSLSGFEEEIVYYQALIFLNKGDVESSYNVLEKNDSERILNLKTRVDEIRNR